MIITNLNYYLSLMSYLLSFITFIITYNLETEIEITIQYMTEGEVENRRLTYYQVIPTIKYRPNERE